MVKRFSAWLLLMIIVFFSGCVNLHETVVTYQNDKYVSVIHFSISAEDDMLKVRNLGQKSLDEIKKKLEDLGLSLRNRDE